MSFSVKVDIGSFKKTMDDIADRAEKAARPAAQAAAQVLYDEVVKNVSQIGKKTGNLRRAVYQVFSRKRSGKANATYFVSWNRQKAPHGHLLEYGHIQRFQTYLGKDGKWHTLKNKPLATPRQVAAQPFLRPAKAKFPQALEAAKKEFIDRINEKTK